MSSKKSSSSVNLGVKTPSSTGKSTSFGHKNAAPNSSMSTSSKPSKGSSYMLEAWRNSDKSSDPWTSAKVTYR
ncbi:uncharacterized protein N7529_006585 [Penicillium soppii]|uniref:uncharacterized protein n=1 Tax=Penicillium soppii TaxID=69789 RepID=UPI002547456F|nr:uncharacterized protein N7529_006585 [Penicillium soppii]KAJ5864669.1 hypothetical protein N7529_006585 [Penicillium soppii]